MKKICILIFSLLLSLSFIAGCQSNETKNMDSTHEINVEELLKYKESYVGDNSAVGGILYNLPGNIFVKEFSLETSSSPYGIKVHYGLDENSNVKEQDLKKYWNNENVKKIFLNNATTLFILVKNVDEVKFNLDIQNKQSFSISRKELETFYGKDLRKYAEDKSLWEKEILEGTLNSSEKLEDFFQIHSITTE